MIVPIVEGQSEERAMGVLMRRVLHDAALYDLEVARPFRVKRQRAVRAGELEKSIVQAERSRVGATSIFLILDADDDCPADLGLHLLERVRAQTNLPARVVFAKVEIEAWVLAAVDSLRGVRGIRANAQPPASPEEIRDAKRALTRLMEAGRGYLATDDLAALVAGLDLQLAEGRAPSFAKFCRDLRSLVDE